MLSVWTEDWREGGIFLWRGLIAKGWNEHSIGICYIGGLDVNGHPADTRTKACRKGCFIN